MPAVKKKEAIARTYNIRADLVRRLDAYKAASGVPNTFVLERALERYLDEVAPVENRAGGSEGSGRSPDGHDEYHG